MLFADSEDVSIIVIFTKILGKVFFSTERTCFVLEIMLLKILGIHSLIVGGLRFRYRHEPSQFLGQQPLMYILKMEEASLMGTFHM